MMNDPIADFLTRIRNAAERNKKIVEIKYSRIVEEIIKVLAEKNIILGYRVEYDEDKTKSHMKKIVVELAYDSDRGNIVSRITGTKRESKPGVRKYISYQEIPRVRSGFGIAILSTSKGIMSGKEAKEAKLGGELLCTIW